MSKRKATLDTSQKKWTSTLAHNAKFNKFKEIFSKPQKSDEDVRYIYERVKDMAFFSNFIAEQDLTDEEAILDICRRMRLERYFPGEVIFYEDDPSYGKFYVVLRGVVYVVQSTARAKNVFEEENVQQKDKSENQKAEKSESSSCSGSLNNSLMESKVRSLKSRLTINSPVPLLKSSRNLDEEKKSDTEKIENKVPQRRGIPPRKIVNARNSIRMFKPPEIIVEAPAEKNIREPDKSLSVKFSEPQSARIGLPSPTPRRVSSFKSEIADSHLEIQNPKTEILAVNSDSDSDSSKEEEEEALKSSTKIDEQSRQITIQIPRKEQTHIVEQESSIRSGERKPLAVSHFQIAKSRIQSFLRWPKNFNFINNIAPATIKERIEQYGKLVGRLTKGIGFGEAALKDYDSKRNATIIAATEIELLALETKELRLVRQHFYSNQAIKQEFMLQYFPFLDHVNAPKYIQNYVYLMIQKKFPLDTMICREGEISDRFFVLFEGNCSVFKTFHIQESSSKFFRTAQNQKQIIPISVIEKGAFIGEEILFNSDSKFEYNVKVTSPTAMFFSINKAAFLKKFPRDTLQLLKKIHEKKRHTHLNTVQAVLTTKYSTAKVTSSPTKITKVVTENNESEPKELDAQDKPIETPQNKNIAPQKTQEENFDKGFTLLREPILVIPNRQTVFRKALEQSPILKAQNYNNSTSAQDQNRANNVDAKTNKERLNEFFRVPTTFSQIATSKKNPSLKNAATAKNKLDATKRKWSDLLADSGMKVDEKKVEEYKKIIENLQDCKPEKNTQDSAVKSNSSGDLGGNTRSLSIELKNLKHKEKIRRRKPLRNEKAPVCPIFDYYDHVIKAAPELGIKRGSDPTVAKIENIKYNFGREDDLLNSKFRGLKLKVDSFARSQTNQEFSSVNTSKKESSVDEPCHLLYHLRKAKEESINFKVKQLQTRDNISKLVSMASTPRESRGNLLSSRKSNPFATSHSSKQQFSPHSPSTRVRNKHLVMDNNSDYFQGTLPAFSMTSSGFQFNNDDFCPKNNSQLTSCKNAEHGRRTTSGGKINKEKDETPFYVKNLLDVKKTKSITRQRGLLKEVIDRRANSEEKESFSRNFSMNSLYEN